MKVFRIPCVCLALCASRLLCQSVDSAVAVKERNAARILLRVTKENIEDAAAAMPADKFGFAPKDGEFKNVRTFSREVRHLAATNYILAAAALGEAPPQDAGDEAGPDSVVTKAQHLAYLHGSYAALERAIDAIPNTRMPVRTSPISPLQGETATRESLIMESIIHSYDHYGQMVVYLRMNGVIPPASRR